MKNRYTFDFMIIGISAKIGHGKDTVGAMIKSATPNFDFQIKKFAYKLKQIVSLLTGVSVEDLEKEEVKNSFLPSEWNDPITGKQMTYREALQWVGTDAMRDKVHTNVWVNALFADLVGVQNWIITDVRFPNEAAAIKSRGGLMIRVERPFVGARSNHPSETGLDDYPDFDHVIINDGSLEDLNKKIVTILLSHGLM